MTDPRIKIVRDWLCVDNPYERVGDLLGRLDAHHRKLVDKYGYDADSETAERILSRVRLLTTAEGLTVRHVIWDCHWLLQADGGLEDDLTGMASDDSDDAYAEHSEPYVARYLREAGFPMTPHGEARAALADRMREAATEEP